MIVAANRPPVSYGRDRDGEMVARRGAGGLVTALRALVGRTEVTWIASAISATDRELAASEPRGRSEQLEGGTARIRLLAHEPGAYELYYGQVANPVLWFTQHQLWNLPYEPSFGTEFRAAWEDGYRVVNEAFAAAVADELALRPNDPVVLHDYHLYLAGRGVRVRVPAASLAQFVHIPWPPPDAFAVLPVAVVRSALDGLLACDVVGFHTDRWRDNFMACCVGLLGAEAVDDRTVLHAGRHVRLSVRPISVSPAELRGIASGARVLEEEADILAGRPEFLIVRVDRTDPSKNIVRGFDAFGLLLECHPELHERVQMLALLDASRQDVAAYAEYSQAIEVAATAVNERFGTERWTPVQLEVEDNFARSVAAYKQYDVLLVNPVFDGMNLVAKEGPLLNTRDGCVVLSDNAGAHSELAQAAFSVNPFDISQQAEALYEALMLPAEARASRAIALREIVEARPVAAWSDGLLADLNDAVARDGRTIDV